MVIYNEAEVAYGQNCFWKSLSEDELAGGSSIEGCARMSRKMWRRPWLLRDSPDLTP
jgi:hypothetical protein